MQGLNPDERLAERLVAAVRAEPAAYHDVEALAAAAGVGQTRLFELFRLHYHSTPADMLARLRVAAARSALLETSTSLTAIASDAGFESLPTFHENFRRLTAMSPSDYRRMRETQTFVVALPQPYPLQRILAYLGRDRNSLTDRVEGTTWTSAIRLGPESGAYLRVMLHEDAAQCEVLAPARLGPAGMQRVHAHVLAGLGLQQDPTSFESQVAGIPDLAPLLEGQRGLRVPLINDHFDGLIWAIVAQQITLAFAYILRRRVIERTSQEIVPGVFLPPAPHTVAELTIEELAGMSFSRAKAAYLIGAAQAMLDGRLPLEQLEATPVTQIERLLLAQRGIGPWSANYLLMRSYGFVDCVPVGDAGLTASLQRFFKLEQRPDKRATLALMEPFSPYRSLATFHLWQWLGTQG